MSVDLTLFSLYRHQGRDYVEVPDVALFEPLRRVVRGRERIELLIFLHLSGNLTFSAEEHRALKQRAAERFYTTPGPLTTALRAAAESVNQALLERNLTYSGRSQYVIGHLMVAALRETQLMWLQCGLMHVLAWHGGQTRHFYDPSLAGRGLGLSQGVSRFFSQLVLETGDRLLICPDLPPAWEAAFAVDRGRGTPDIRRKQLLAMVEGDTNGLLIQVSGGTPGIRWAQQAAACPAEPEAEASARTAVAVSAFPASPEPAAWSTSQEVVQAPPRSGEGQSPQRGESPSAGPAEAAASAPVAHHVGLPPLEAPSAYALPPQADPEALVEQLASAVMAGEPPPSLPRREAEGGLPADGGPALEGRQPARSSSLGWPPSSPSQPTTQRQMARLVLGSLDGWRGLMTTIRQVLSRFLPSLLPTDAPSGMAPLSVQVFLSILIPILVATVGVAIYLRFGVSTQFDAYLLQARALREQALKASNPVDQRQAWASVLQRVEQAETYDRTPESQALRREAQARLDALLGVTRLRFTPILTAELNAQVSRMAASDTDLYLLDAVQGDILRVAITGQSYQLDASFSCKPGTYGNLTVGSFVDLLVLPKVNALNSSVLGVDAMGNLLYCAPGQAPRWMALPLPPTNWGRVTALALDSGRLYVLDAPARAVWIYVDQNGVYLDPPLLFFDSQVPEIRDAIDLAVMGDDLYLLHADGRLTHCTYSRLEGVPTRCVSPAPLINRFPAYGEQNVFAQAHFTQLILSGIPDSVLLLLDADGRSIYRLSLPGFELQGIWRAAEEDLPANPLGALACSPNRLIYLAQGGQAYVTLQAP